MGRNREPAALSEAKGSSNIGKDELKRRYEQELKVDLTEVHAPSWLDGGSAEEFYEIAAKLAHVDERLFTELDEDVLARYLVAKSSYVEMTSLVSKEMKKKRGQDVDKLAKLTRAQNTYFNQCHTCASALGLTITSRCRIVIPKVEEAPKANRFAKFDKGTAKGR